MQKIVPNIWFNNNAKEATEFYTSIFPNSKIVSTTNYPKNAEEGLVDFQLDMAGKPLTIDFEIGGCCLTAINAGPEFKPNPSISFMVNFDPSQDKNVSENIDKLWENLQNGGKVLMPLQEYPFSKKYGWVQDKFGVNWQIILTNPDGELRPFIVPSLLFSGENTNRAEEAMSFYFSVFKNAKEGMVARYQEATGLAKAGALMFADFTLENQWFVAMDSGVEHVFSFTEGVSFLVFCKDQEEIDRYWEKLSSQKESEQCGWCKDKFGVSWQIVPVNMNELMKKPNAFAIMMRQKKIVISDYFL
jgi:predicted 3-demethylubiquinone-9 3-methyltransferase (glyoxalase superfamily)